MPLDLEACRQLASAILLRACLDAAAGRGEALAWIYSDAAAQMAEGVGLESWPPKPGQLAPKRVLIKRARGEPCPQ